jgi:hypothetical protein
MNFLCYHKKRGLIVINKIKITWTKERLAEVAHFKRSLVTQLNIYFIKTKVCIDQPLWVTHTHTLISIQASLPKESKNQQQAFSVKW